MVEIKASETFCPIIKGECLQLKCSWFIKLVGTDTNTGKPIEDWGCAVRWIPTLLVENSNMQRQTGAAVESFRNEMVKANEANPLALAIQSAFPGVK